MSEVVDKARSARIRTAAGMKISVIITTYNCPLHLDRVLHGYGIQTDGNFDIIVADDGSGQQTAEVIESHRDRWPFRISHVFQEDRGFRKTVILNKAIVHSDADYLIFTDGDLIPRMDFVASHREFCEPGHYIAGSYSRLPAKISNRVTVEDVLKQNPFNVRWLVRHGYLPNRVRFFVPRRFGFFLDRFGKVDWGRFTGGNASAFRKDVVAIGGFNEQMVSHGHEDREFGTRLRNSGIRSKRLKNATFLMHLDHPRPYVDPQGSVANAAILRETVRQGRTVSPKSIMLE